MPKLQRNYTRKISLHLTDDQYENLQAHAEMRGCTSSELLRRLIDDLEFSVELPESVKSKLHQIAAGQRRLTPAKLIEDILRREWGGRWGWR